MKKKGLKLNWNKLRAVVVHVIGRCDSACLGAVKLHKVLYYSDMLMYLETGEAITGAVYKKRPFGPTCDPLLSVLSELSKEEIIRIDTVDYHGFQKKEFTALNDTDTNHLSETEKAVLGEIVEFVCNNNSAKTISEFSHDMVWDMVEFGEEIPYYNAIHLIPNEVSLEAKNWADTEISKVENSRSKSPQTKLAYKDVRAVRAGLEEMRQRRHV